MKRTSLILSTLLVLATIAAGVVYARRGDDAPLLTTDVVSRGNIVNVVSATGTLQAVTMVQVGSQVSGAIEALNADFNSLVRRGQVLATLDPSTYRTAVEQADASLGNAEAEVDRLRVAQSAAEAALSRARELSARQLLPAADLEAADSATRSAKAQVTAAAAKVVQAKSAVQTARVNLDKTIIRSPIDGVVIARNVDVGQTVAASLSAPTLFVIAADLSEMQVNASIDESDLGQIREKQPVTFHVDAYPSETFTGSVSQVRLSPTTANNVVTYAAIIDAANPRLKLKPGMTANVSIEVARRDEVLRVPSAALRFKPDAQTLAAFGATAPAGKGPVVWLSDGKILTSAPVTIGATDGSFTEVEGMSLREGSKVVTRATLASASASVVPAAATNNPLMPSRPGQPRR